MEQQTAQTESNQAATEEQKATRDSGVWLVFAKGKDGVPVLAERKTKKEAQAAIEEVGVDNVLAVYKQAKEVVLKTKVQVQF